MPTPKDQVARTRPIYLEEFADQALRLCKVMAATEAQLAEYFGASVQSISVWKNKYPKFKAALTEGRATPDDQVELTLFQLATGGFEVEKKHVHMVKGKLVTTPYFEKLPPCKTSCIFWLKNRRHAEWRDRREVEFSGDTPVQTIRIELVEAHPRSNGADTQYPDSEDIRTTH